MNTIFTPKKKSEIIKEHFLKGIPIEDICNTYQITPLTFKKWKTNMFENIDLLFKQIPDDGMSYYQNYDLVINYLSQAFKGQTLNVLGIDTAPIKRVCSFKPVEIAVNTGVIDVILVSGRPYNGKRKIQTHSGLYQPTFVDLTKRNGKERFKQIREAVESGDTTSLLELAFLPMYGNDDDIDRIEFVKDIIRFETELLKQDPTKELLVAATMIMSNKILDNETFDKLWEEIKMIKVLAFAEEKGYDRGINEGYDKGKNEGYDKGKNEGYDKGKNDGINEGVLKSTKMMLIEALEETIGVVPEYIEKKIEQITSQTTLKGLFRQAIRCNDIKDFNQKLALATS